MGMSFAYGERDDEHSAQTLNHALDIGVNFLDTADVYGTGHNEELIGRAVGGRRGEIFLATKFGYVQGPAGHPYDPKFMREQAERSLRNMRTGVIDLYYFHHCDFGDRFDEVLEVMHRLRDEGKIRFVGLSDWDASKIMKYIERVDPDVVQPYRNLVDDDYEPSGLKSYVDTHDLGVAFFSPLKHGLLLGKYDAPQTFPEGDFRSGIADFRDAEAIARYKRAAQMVGARLNLITAVTGALLAGNPTACVLLGQRNVRQVEEAARAGDALSIEDAQWVRAQYRG